MKGGVTSFLFGDMMRTLLIQIQKGKVDAESVMFALDKLIRANELNFQIFAAVPVIYCIGYGGEGRV